VPHARSISRPCALLLLASLSDRGAASSAAGGHHLLRERSRRGLHRRRVRWHQRRFCADRRASRDVPSAAQVVRDWSHPNRNHTAYQPIIYCRVSLRFLLGW